jgi:hypothetical protein
VKKNPLFWFCISIGVVIYITSAAFILDPFTCKHKAYIHMKGYIIVCFKMHASRDSSVRIATRYELQGPGIESWWGEIFRTYPDRLRGQSSLLYNGYRVFPGCKSGWGVMLTTYPVLAPRLRKS